MQIMSMHLDLLSDNSQDSEIRIAAYLSVMSCPSATSLLRNKKILDVEEYNQGWCSIFLI